MPVPARKRRDGYLRTHEGAGYSFKQLSIFSPKSNAGKGRVEKNEGERDIYISPVSIHVVTQTAMETPSPALACMCKTA